MVLCRVGSYSSNMRTGKVRCNSLMENCRPYQVTSAACLGDIVPLRHCCAGSGLYKSLIQESSLSGVVHNSLLLGEVMLVVLATASYFIIEICVPILHLCEGFGLVDLVLCCTLRSVVRVASLLKEDIGISSVRMAKLVAHFSWGTLFLYVLRSKGFINVVSVGERLRLYSFIFDCSNTLLRHRTGTETKLNFPLCIFVVWIFI